MTNVSDEEEEQEADFVKSRVGGPARKSQADRAEQLRKMMEDDGKR